VSVADILSLFTGSGTYEVILPCFKTVARTVVQFLTAISTVDETGEHIALACSGWSAFVLAKFLPMGSAVWGVLSEKIFPSGSRRERHF